MQDAGEVCEDRRLQRLAYHTDHFRDVIICLSKEDDIPLRINDHDQRNRYGQGRGFVGSAVSLECEIIIAVNDILNPFAVELRQIPEPDLIPDQMRVVQEKLGVLPGGQAGHPLRNLLA